MDSNSDSYQDCLCLFCREIGHIVEKCPLYIREWATTADLEVDTDVDMNSDSADSDTDVGPTRPSPPFTPLPITEESTQAMCQRCTQLDELCRIADHRPILWEDLEDVLEDDGDMERVDRKTTQIRPLGLVRSLRLLSTCPLCRLIFNMSYLTDEAMGAVSSAEGELVLVTGWTIHRLEPHLHWEGWKRRRGPYAKCVYTSVTDIYEGDIRQPQDHVNDVEEAIGIIDTEDQSVGLGVRQVDSKAPSYRIINDWLRRCDNFHHLICRPLVSEDLRQIKLVDVETRRIVSYPVSGCDYIALSYVWGDVEQSSYKLGDILPTVPATLEDAMVVVHNLRKQYLWVDSLCIDQENETEQATQIALMSTIYSGAWATIVSLSGKSAESGLPRVGRLQNVIPQSSYELWGKRFLSVMPTLQQQILWSTWGSRAWTEGLLSSRCLFFTNHQVYFECNSVHCCESLNDTSSPFHLQTDEERRAELDKMVQGGDTSDTGAEGVIGRGILRNPFRTISDVEEAQVDVDSFATYLGCVNSYTERQMTHDFDSLNAFTAVLTCFEKKWYKGGFLHGLPIDDLPRALSWVHVSQQRRRQVDFPAWSWVGWEGQVSDDAKYRTSKVDKKLAPPLRIWKAGRNDTPELIYVFNPTLHIIEELARRTEEENNPQDGMNDDDGDLGPSKDEDLDCLGSYYGYKATGVEETNDSDSESSIEKINFENDPVFQLSTTMLEGSLAAPPEINGDELLVEGIVIQLSFTKDPCDDSDNELDDEYTEQCFVGLDEDPDPPQMRFYGPDCKRLIRKRESQQQEFVLLSREYEESRQQVKNTLLLIDRSGDVATRVAVVGLRLDMVEHLDSYMPRRMLFKLKG